MTPPARSAIDVAPPLLRYALDVVLSLAIPFLAQLADKRWLLTDEQRSGAWNTASWGSAVYGFGPLSMIGWAWVTRSAWSGWRERDGVLLAFLRTVGLLAVGLVAAVVAFAVLWGLDQLAALALGLKP